MDKDASAEALGWTLCAVLGLSYGLVAGVAGCRALNLRGRGHGGPWTTQKVLHLLVTLCAPSDQQSCGPFLCVKKSFEPSTPCPPNPTLQASATSR